MDNFRILRILGGIFILFPMMIGIVILIKLIDLKEYLCKKKTS